MDSGLGQRNGQSAGCQVPHPCREATGWELRTFTRLPCWCGLASGPLCAVAGRPRFRISCWLWDFPSVQTSGAGSSRATGYPWPAWETRRGIDVVAQKFFPQRHLSREETLHRIAQQPLAKCSIMFHARLYGFSKVSGQGHKLPPKSDYARACCRRGGVSCSDSMVAMPERITGLRWGNSATSDRLPPMASM